MAHGGTTVTVYTAVADRGACWGLCGFLPLAIGMVAGQLRHRPAWTAAGRAAELAAAVDRLELMATENLTRALLLVFDRRR